MAGTITRLDSSFADEMSELAGFRMKDCYQCGKCTAGCPTSYLMDFPIHQVMLLTLQGRREELLRSTAIWLCVSCETCTTRCPKECKPSVVMDMLRAIAVEEGTLNKHEKYIIQFHKSFLKTVEMFGRVYEVGMLADYKVRTVTLMQDLILGGRMFTKGKINLFPDKIKGIKTVKKLFDRYSNW
jgi:heterodisulfide reductase subunit C